MKKLLLIAIAVCTLMAVKVSAAEPLPPVDQLPRNSEFPDALKMRDGTPITTPEQWKQQRRPELKQLFQHYMYGYFPDAPEVKATVDYKNDKAFGGKGTLTCLTLKFGPASAPPLHVLLVVPNHRSGPAPVFVGLNFAGNHALVDDPHVPLPKEYVPSWSKGQINNKATDASRGTDMQVWCLEQTLGRGYAVATAHYGDLDPDKPKEQVDFTDGVHPHFAANPRLTGESVAPGQRGPHHWGAIAAWAWGVQRIVDYVVTNKDLDKSRIAVVGHSRLGKTALLAGAFDDRIGLIIPHQAGCGGTAPNRHKVGETVKQINTAFPHWFCDEFKKFNTDVDRLPFDQHCLVALCAPRPVLFSNAVLDRHADPVGQFRTLQGADPVYRFLGSSGLPQQTFPDEGQLLNGRLGYYIRAGDHSMTCGDWNVFCDFADKQFAATSR